MNKVRTVQPRSLIALWTVIVTLLVAGVAVMVATASSAYAADSITQEITATKTLEGGTLKADQFEFTIEAKTEGAPMPEKKTATNDADGKISFGNATYTAAGTYEYIVKEKEGTDSTITYDTSAKTITVTVTSQSSGGDTPREGVGGYTPKAHATAGEQVTYDHAGGADGAYSDKTVKFADDTVEHVFCGARGASSSSTDFNTRTFWNGKWHANWAGEGVNWDPNYFDGTGQANYPTWLDVVAYHYSYDFFDGHMPTGYTNGYMWTSSDNPGVLTGDALFNAVRRIMVNAYPYNAAGLSEEGLGNFTQQALWFTFQYGKAYRNADYGIDAGGYQEASGNAEAFKALIDFAINGTTADGYSFDDGAAEVYVYWSTGTDATGAQVGDGKSFYGQPLIGVFSNAPTETLSAEATTVAFANTTSSGGGGDNPTIKISKQDMGGEELAGAKLVVKDSSGKTVDSWTSTTTPHEIPLAAGNYVLTETAAPNGYQTVTTEIDFSVDAAGTVTPKTTTVDPAGAVEVGDDGSLILMDALDSEPAASIGTTIKVGGTSAPGGKLLSIEQPADDVVMMYVEDTIEYEGLEAGAEYEVTGKLMAFTGSDTTGTECATETVTFTASDSGEGTWTMSFGHQPLQENTYYVVYETATNKTTPSESSTIEHANPQDLAQAVVVLPTDGITIIPEEVVNNPGDYLVPTSALEMSTTVDIDGKAASANAVRTVAATDASKVKKVNDTVAYEGFGGGETYTLTGKLMDATNAKTAAEAKEVATKTETVKAADSGKGTWKMVFEDVTIEQGHKYVVFEYATDTEGNEVASHADINDKAQTIQVTAQATAKTGTTAKTADTATGVALLALVVAMGSAALALRARRQSDR